MMTTTVMMMMMMMMMRAVCVCVVTLSSSDSQLCDALDIVHIAQDKVSAAVTQCTLSVVCRLSSSFTVCAMRESIGAIIDSHVYSCPSVSLSVCIYITIVARSNFCENVVLRGCGKLRGSKSYEVRFSTSSQPDKNLYVCVCMCVCVYVSVCLSACVTNCKKL